MLKLILNGSFLLLIVLIFVKTVILFDDYGRKFYDLLLSEIRSQILPHSFKMVTFLSLIIFATVGGGHGRSLKANFLRSL